MKKDSRKTIRKFTGNLTGPYENKIDRNFNKAALKAYLKGYQFFFFGKNLDGTPAKHFVPIEYKPL